MMQPSLFEESFASVAVPYFDAFAGEEGGIGRAVDEPKEFFYDAAEEGTFGGEEGQCIGGKGESERGRGEKGECACSSSVRSIFAIGEDALNE
jgi:hypothetical protein